MHKYAVSDLIGIPFKDNARGPDAYDCYGLVKEMYRREGIVLPEYISPLEPERRASLIAVTSCDWQKCERIPGATVALRIGRFVSHVGYMLSPDEMIHSWEKSGGVCIERMNEWENKIAGFWRYKA